MLKKYHRVFEVPQGLPPPRSQDHQISLKEGYKPVNVRPYRYSYFLKYEIERIVANLLKFGMVRPSQSPFSSPMLLVSKSDGSWHMSIDYRILNADTIKDKYPIPIVDELFDELYGSTIFTKLDLRLGCHQIRMKAEDIHKTAFRTQE